MTQSTLDHVVFMRQALELADEAARAGEVPIGAVIVLGGEVIGRGFNQPISASDPTAHAEIVALRDAARTRRNYRLSEAFLYVTIEPCLMCVGAMAHARIATVVYGAPEPRSGALEWTGHMHEHASLNHRMVVVSGVLAAECRDRMQRFFAAKR